jgi:hypothetical protein
MNALPSDCAKVTLGIAHTLGKEIIPLLQEASEIPFDQRPFRILFYADNIDGYQILLASDFFDSDRAGSG